MADIYNAQIKQYEQARKKLENLLRQTPSATGAEPSQRALDLDAQLRETEQQLKQLKGKQKEEQYYGNETKQPIKTEEGLISKGLRYLSTPLYITTGAVETALGKGTKKGLLENIRANVKEQGTMGSLLRSYGAPAWATIPLGFVLDVAADPVSWATAGTSAILPRLGYGIAKAGARGAGEAVVSSALKKAATIGKYVPVLRKTSAYGKLAEKAVESSRSFNALIGRDVKEIIRRSVENPNWFQRTYRGAGLLWVEKLLNKTPKGRQIVGAFKPKSGYYSDLRYLDDLDRTQRAATGLGEMPRKGEISEIFAEIANIQKGRSQKSLLNAMKSGVNKIDEPLRIARNAIREGGEMASSRSILARAAGIEELNYRMAGEAMNDAEFKIVTQNIINKYYGGKTGVAKLDKLFNVFFEKLKVGNIKIGEKIVDSYGAYMGMFKSAKIASPTGAVNATVGNVTMIPLAGLNPLNLDLMRKINNSRKLLWALMRKKPLPKEFVDSILKDPQWAAELNKFPGAFKGVYGFDPKFLLGRRFADDAALKVSEILQGMGKYKNELEASLDSKAMLQAARDSYAGLPEVMEGVASGLARGMTEAGIPGSQISYEIYRGGFNKFIKKLSELEAKGSKGAKALKWIYTHPMDYYETIDQSFKFGTALYLSQIGITERELLSLKRTLPSLNAIDITEDIATGLFKLSPKAASEAALEIFMNYAAMPSAVKVLRVLPFFGAPFASFMYSMTIKTGKALKYNPDAFNKISFLIQEINGEKTPLERQALKSPYFQWYNQNGMVRLPFFKENPVYLNVANMLPYYTMNAFQPSERRYDNDPKMKKLSEIWDRLPIGKTPEMQMVWDYFVQPLIIKNSNPRGMFDQPLYGSDASALAKYAGYPARSLTEAVVPSALGVAGIATGLTAPQITEYMPEYRWRQLANAVQGMSSVGTLTKEPAVQKTLRALSALMGLPVYTLNPQYQSKEK